MRSVKKRHMRGACVCLCVCLCALPLLEALAENAAAPLPHAHPDTRGGHPEHVGKRHPRDRRDSHTGAVYPHERAGRYGFRDAYGQSGVNRSSDGYVNPGGFRDAHAGTGDVRDPHTGDDRDAHAGDVRDAYAGDDRDAYAGSGGIRDSHGCSRIHPGGKHASRYYGAALSQPRSRLG